MTPTVNSFIRRGCIGVLLACILSPLAIGEDSTSVSYGRLALFGGVTAATITTIHLYQQNAWWQGPRADFWLDNDWELTHDVDKFGHMYGSYLATNAFAAGFRWSGFSRHSSVLYGATAAILFQLYVEMEDGYHRYYGFSPGDLFADFSGAAFALAQESFPVMEHFRLKWSYFPSKEYRDALREGQARAFIDDYEGQKYWLGVDPHFLFGESLQKVVPRWLGFAVGYGMDGYILGARRGKEVFYLALDYNFRYLAEGDGFLPTILRVLDFVHLPAPGISIRGSNVRFGIVF